MKQNRLVNKKPFERLRNVLPLGAVTIFTLILLLWIAPLSQFDAVRALSFSSLVMSFWLAFVGFLFISIGVLAIPDMRNAPAKIAGLFFVGFGLIALIFSAVAITLGIDVITGDQFINFFATILFAGATIILFADLLPRIGLGKGLIKATAQAT